MTADPVHIAAILAQYTAASPAQRAAGRAWYGTARDLVDVIAGWSGAAPDRVAAALAALSPRNPWYWNVADAAAYARASGIPGAPMPTATTFGANRVNAWRMLGADGAAADWRTAAPKVRAFVRAIMGDTTAVVVDVWAIRVATRGARSTVTDAEYDDVAQAYTVAAGMLGDITPRDLQAVTWIAAQSAGIGSRRIGRHDRTCKRGTPPIVREALTGQRHFGWIE